MFENIAIQIQNLLTSSDKPMKKLAKMKNNLSFMNTYFRGLNIGFQRYKINGLPDTIKEQDIKRYLLFKGSVILFEQAGGWFALPGGGMADINVNGHPGNAWIYGANGFSKQVKLAIPGGFDSSFARKGFGSTMAISDKAFIIRENYVQYPFINYIIEMAEAISDTMRTLDIARKNVKHPYIITAEESIINTVLKYFDNRDNNEEFIISSGIFPADKIKMLPLEQNPECIKTSTDLIEWYWNLFFTLCGFDSNGGPDKKAQVSVVEVNSNNAQIAVQAASVINSLKEDFDFFNQHTGLNITVEKTDLSEYNDSMELNSTQSDGGDKDVPDRGDKDI